MKQRIYIDTSVFGGHFDEEFKEHMKTTKKTFDALKFMRQQRNKLSEKLSKMTKEEIIEYFKKPKTKTAIKPSA